jgi:hypothetical protein
VQSPSRLHVVGCLAAIDPVIAEEILRKLANGDPFVSRSDKCPCVDFRETFGQNAVRLPLVRRSGGFTK